MDESAPINTIGDDYIDIIGNKITTINTSVRGLIEKYGEKLDEIKKLQPNGSDKSGESDESDGNDGSDGTQNCSDLQTKFDKYKNSVDEKIAELLATMKHDANRLEKLNEDVTTAVGDDGNPFTGGRKHKRSKKRSKHNKRRTTHKKQSRRRRRH